eukprot:SAG22_NODE_16_length_32723_cov_26.404825_8_plen_54_part_00
MWRLANEVWDAIPIEDLRPYMLKVEKNWAAIKAAKGCWVGWGQGGAVRHGVGS